MMAWEYLEEPINENESDSENFNHQIMKKIQKRIRQKKKKPMLSSQNHLLQLIMII